MLDHSYTTGSPAPEQNYNTFFAPLQEVFPNIGFFRDAFSSVFKHFCLGRGFFDPFFEATSLFVSSPNAKPKAHPARRQSQKDEEGLDTPPNDSPPPCRQVQADRARLFSRHSGNLQAQNRDFSMSHPAFFAPVRFCLVRTDVCPSASLRGRRGTGNVGNVTTQKTPQKQRVSAFSEFLLCYSFV